MIKLTKNYPLNTVGERIYACRKQMGLTLQELGDKLSTKPHKAVVNKWEMDINIPSSINLRDLSRLFDCSIDWLLSGKNEPTAINKWIYPIISYDDIINQLDLPCILNMTDTFYATKQYIDNTIALPVMGDAMMPSFTDKMTILCEPVGDIIRPKHNDFVLAKNNDIIIFRQYMIDGNRHTLKPLNTHYQIEYITAGYMITHIVREYAGVT